MTTDNDKGTAAAQEEEETSFLPTVLAGAGILAVAALLIFWPSDDEDKAGAKDKNGKVAAADGAGKGRAGGAAAGGVGARQADAPTTPASRRRNPAIKLPPNTGMATEIPADAPKDPPATATHEEKIAFYEDRLTRAIALREKRKQFADRLPKVRERIEASANPEASLKTFEQRKKIVEDNYDKAKQEVEDIEGKLAALRGS